MIYYSILHIDHIINKREDHNEATHQRERKKVMSQADLKTEQE